MNPFLTYAMLVERLHFWPEDWGIPVDIDEPLPTMH